MPDVLRVIEAEYTLLRRLLGVKNSEIKVSSLKDNEMLMINVGSQSLGGKVVRSKKGSDSVKIEFAKPVCANVGDKIALSRKVENNFRLIGWGEIKKCYTTII